MFGEMRRKKQALPLETCEKILERGNSGVLALEGEEGYPYAVPLSYFYEKQKIFFHCARNGYKIEAIKRNEKASFCVIDQDQIVPKEKNNKDSSNGKFSKKEAETNGLRSHYRFTGDGSRSSRPEPFDAGFIHHHTSVDDNYHHSSRASCHSGWDDGGCDTSSSSSYSGSCCD